MSVSIVKREWFQWILCILAATLLFDFITHYFVASEIISRTFRMTTEKNIPTLISTVQLMFSGTLLYATYIMEKKSNSDSKWPNYWKYLAIIFYFLAFDEWFSIHDPFGLLIADYMGGVGDLFGWTLAYAGIMILFFIWYLRFLTRLPKKTAGWYVISGAIFLIGAIGFELLNSSDIQGILGVSLTGIGIYLVGLLEESFEMLGIFIFNFVTFLYIKLMHKEEPVVLNNKLYKIAIVFFVIDIIGTYYFQYWYK